MWPACFQWTLYYSMGRVFQERTVSWRALKWNQGGVIKCRINACICTYCIQTYKYCMRPPVCAHVFMYDGYAHKDLMVLTPILKSWHLKVERDWFWLCFLFQLTFKKKNKFTYLFIFGCVGSFVAACGLSLVAVSGGYASLLCAGFSLQWLLLLRSTGSRRVGFSICGTPALEYGLSSCGARA